MTVCLCELSRSDEDSYVVVLYAIMLDDLQIGSCVVMVDSSSWSYVERIDIDVEYRCRGYGSEALRQISSIYGGVAVAPDSEDSARLYARLGSVFVDDVTSYIDQGYGVYMI